MFRPCWKWPSAIGRADRASSSVKSSCCGSCNRRQKALLHSATFRPFLGGHIPPDWFVVRDEHLSEVRGLLERLGFTIGDSLDPPPLGGLENPAKDSPAAVDRTNSIAKRPARTIMAAG